MEQIIKCGICEEKAAFICLQCMNYFCEPCYKYVHDKKEKTNHKKESIDYFAPINVKCPLHQKYPLDFFCLDEKGNYIYRFIIQNILYRIMLHLLHNKRKSLFS